MLQPSYSELMTILNETNEVDSKITSRYTIVIAAAKRARQLTESSSESNRIDKAVTHAVNEMAEGKIKIIDESNGDGYYVALREMLQENKEDFMNDTF